MSTLILVGRFQKTIQTSIASTFWAFLHLDCEYPSRNEFKRSCFILFLMHRQNNIWKWSFASHSVRNKYLDSDALRVAADPRRPVSSVVRLDRLYPNFAEIEWGYSGPPFGCAADKQRSCVTLDSSDSFLSIKFHIARYWRYPIDLSLRDG